MTKEQDAARKRTWRKDNPERHREDQWKYYIRHRRKVRARQNAYKRHHPIKGNLLNAKRRTAKTQAGGRTTPAQWIRICRAVKFRCLCCGKRKKLEGDHVIPVSKGGSSFPHNIQPLCKSCNAMKHTKSTDFRFLPKWRTIFTRLFTRKWFRF